MDKVVSQRDDVGFAHYPLVFALVPLCVDAVFAPGAAHEPRQVLDHELGSAGPGLLCILFRLVRLLFFWAGRGPAAVPALGRRQPSPGSHLFLRFFSEVRVQVFLAVFVLDPEAALCTPVATLGRVQVLDGLVFQHVFLGIFSDAQRSRLSDVEVPEVSAEEREDLIFYFLVLRGMLPFVRRVLKRRTGLDHRMLRLVRRILRLVRRMPRMLLEVPFVGRGPKRRRRLDHRKLRLVKRMPRMLLEVPFVGRGPKRRRRLDHRMLRLVKRMLHMLLVVPFMGRGPKGRGGWDHRMLLVVPFVGRGPKRGRGRELILLLLRMLLLHLLLILMLMVPRFFARWLPTMLLLTMLLLRTLLLRTLLLRTLLLRTLLLTMLLLRTLSLRTFPVGSQMVALRTCAEGLQMRLRLILLEMGRRQKRVLKILEMGLPNGLGLLMLQKSSKHLDLGLFFRADGLRGFGGFPGLCFQLFFFRLRWTSF